MSIRIIIDIIEPNEEQERPNVIFESYKINDVTEVEKYYHQRILNFIENDFRRDGDIIISRIINER